MLLAIKTLQAIEDALYKDQGAKYRGLLGELMPLAGDAYSTKEEDFRDHLGASIIGRECAREVYYGFRWTTLTHFNGRMLRLFNRGHLEEPRFIALLMMIGCQVWQITEDGKQFRISGHRGHFGGSLDGVAKGIPDLPEEPMLTEFKTHGDNSFSKLKAVGVMSAKWEHFIQMQIYMGKNNLKWALYGAVNKNDDDLHLELVQFDPTQYQKYLDRSAMVIDAKTPPPKISTSPGWFKCKFCDHKGVCHGKDLPAINCRTCSYSEACDDGKWVCNISKETLLLTSKKQRQGCSKYIVNPVLKAD